MYTAAVHLWYIQAVHYKGLRVYILHLHSPSLQVQLQQRWVGKVGRIGVKSNSRSGALAVRVIAGLVDKDFNVQLLHISRVR